jgi:hypothetical protein
MFCVSRHIHHSVMMKRVTCEHFCFQLPQKTLYSYIQSYPEILIFEHRMENVRDSFTILVLIYTIFIVAHNSISDGIINIHINVNENYRKMLTARMHARIYYINKSTLHLIALN